MMRPLPALVLLGLLGATAASAQSNPNTLQGQSFARFRVQDKCIADATRQFPDRDLVSLQKRDGAVDQCLADHGMPPRQHIAPSSPQPEVVAPKPE
jgi:hypothetical protein